MPPDYISDLCAAARIRKVSRGSVTNCDSHFPLRLIEFIAPLLDKRRKTISIERESQRAPSLRRLAVPADSARKSSFLSSVSQERCA